MQKYVSQTGKWVLLWGKGVHIKGSDHEPLLYIYSLRFLKVNMLSSITCKNFKSKIN